MQQVLKDIVEFFETHELAKGQLFVRKSQCDNPFFIPEKEDVKGACIYGALMLVTRDNEYNVVHNNFAKYLGFETTFDLIEYNNHERTTKDDIINLLKGKIVS